MAMFVLARPGILGVVGVRGLMSGWIDAVGLLSGSGACLTGLEGRGSAGVCSRGDVTTGRVLGTCNGACCPLYTSSYR